MHKNNGGPFGEKFTSVAFDGAINTPPGVFFVHYILPDYLLTARISSLAVPKRGTLTV